MGHQLNLPKIGHGDYLVKLNDPTLPELSYEELIDCIYKAKLEKKSEMARKEHLKKVNMPPVYPKPSAEEFLNSLKEKYPDWEIKDYEIEIVNQLSYYFTNDNRFDGDLSKGIMLTGPVGVGKTFLMEVFSDNPKTPYLIRNTLDIVSQFERKYKAGESYNFSLAIKQNLYNPSFYGHKHYGFCLDDLAAERLLFGSTNLMDELLMNAYTNKHQEKSAIGSIHVTTNASKSDLVQKYGVRLCDRMKEMFNTLDFPEDAPSRRK